MLCDLTYMWNIKNKNQTLMCREGKWCKISGWWLMEYSRVKITKSRLFVLSCLVVTLWLWPTRFLYPWDFPGRNFGVGCHLLLQRIFPTQGSNPCLFHLLHWQASTSPLCHLWSPTKSRLLNPKRANTSWVTQKGIVTSFLQFRSSPPRRSLQILRSNPSSLHFIPFKSGLSRN